MRRCAVDSSTAIASSGPRIDARDATAPQSAISPNVRAITSGGAAAHGAQPRSSTVRSAPSRLVDALLRIRLNIVGDFEAHSLTVETTFQDHVGRRV